MAKPKYHLHLKGYVGGWDFDSDYVDYIIEKYKGEHIDVLIDSTGGYVGTALSVAAAFRRHGDVSVHFVGLNASAATLASLGAKHISIDRDAMYLVHKCSTFFLEWGSKNADQFEQLIKDATKVKEDLDKFDLNASQQYAARCKRGADEMLALMGKGGWLTAQEALDWGFVDEITSYEEDEKSLQVTEALVEAMASNGIPLPQNFNFQNTGKESLLKSLLNKITSPFKAETKEPEAQEPGPADEPEQEETTNNKTTTYTMEKLILLCALLSIEAIELTDNKASLTEEQLNMIENALGQNAKEIEDLKKKNEELQAKLDSKPGDTTTAVTENSKGGQKEKSDFEAYLEDWNNAKSAFDALP